MNTPKYCWDTSVFLAWLNREQSAPLADIDALVRDIEAGRANLIVSVNTYTEMLRAKHTQEQADAFDGFLRRKAIIRVDVSFPIAQKAEQIRSRALTLFKKGQKRTIGTADSQIIATAIVHGCEVLHSLEPQHQNLSGHAAVDGLQITAPRHISGQMALKLDLNPS
jgi:predicted nucleic acid-binding protein